MPMCHIGSCDECNQLSFSPSLPFFLYMYINSAYAQIGKKEDRLVCGSSRLLCDWLMAAQIVHPTEQGPKIVR